MSKGDTAKLTCLDFVLPVYHIKPLATTRGSGILRRKGVMNMKKFQFTCSCGDNFTVDAMTKEEAVEKMMAKMTPEAMTKHMEEKHPGQPMPNPEQAKASMMATIQEM